MSNELAPEDKTLLKEISDLLNQLKPLLNKADHLLNNECFAVEVEETKYIECVSWAGEFYTAGKVYKVTNDIIIDNKGVADDYSNIMATQPNFKPSTREAYEKQQVPVKEEWSPKVGEWFKDEEGSLWLCFDDSKETFQGNDQNGMITHIPNPPTEKLSKPTEIEVGNWLTRIAEQRYPLGTKVKSNTSEFEFIVVDHQFQWQENKLQILGKSTKGTRNAWWCVWRNSDGWASIIKEEITETKERWLPKYDERYWFVQIAGDVIVGSYPCKDTALDKKYIENGNCFKTEEIAQSAADKIRNLLINS